MIRVACFCGHVYECAGEDSHIVVNGAQAVVAGACPKCGRKVYITPS